MQRSKVSKSVNSESVHAEKILPSQFMRQLRPDCYSDTKDRVAYVFDASTLGYCLQSLTNRNETNDFEIFCRKLCERTICTNLRAHTGPDGGGDSKVDTENYPVSEEISLLFYIGNPKATQERWAFAFSAKEKWEGKVKSDVKGIIGTGRKYKNIIFITNQFAKDKKRSKIEDDLSEEYGIPVTIHDRSWIVKQVIENEHRDIAFHHLKVGHEKTDTFRLGQTDYSRAQQLVSIEKAIGDPEAFVGMEIQRVSEALVAAKLSRNIEKPRLETDGRFERAVRLAKAEGTYRQNLEANYERIWTAFWWFDDFQFLKTSYPNFEALALRSGYAVDLELLSNILQLLVNSVIHKHLSEKECELTERTARLKTVLEKIADDKNSPNNALEAKTLLLIMRMNQILLMKSFDQLTGVWREISTVLEEAKGLVEFRAEQLVKLIEVFGNVTDNDTDYNELVEKTAKFVAERKGEAEGALVLLKRAQKIDLDNNFDIIRFLGKAVIGLSKKEYTEFLIDALIPLTVAYRSAGLLWASRATCAFLGSALITEGEKNSQIPIKFVPTMKTWGWIALQNCHFPDFLFAIQMLNGALASLPLSAETKEKVEKSIQELDLALGCLILNLELTDLQKLESLPDILEALGLHTSRSALLFALGHIEVLRSEKIVPEDMSDRNIEKTFSQLASSPVSQNLKRYLILNAETPEVFNTKIVGMTFEVNTAGNLNSILVAETILGSLEAFFATAIDHEIVPHTEKFQLKILKGEYARPSLDIDKLNMSGTVYWPDTLSPAEFQYQKEIQELSLEVCKHVLYTCYFVQDEENFLKSVFTDEIVQHRLMMIATAMNCYHRVTGEYVCRISDWQDVQKKNYEMQPCRPSLDIMHSVEPGNRKDTGKNYVAEKPPMPKDHQSYIARSVIDIHAWDGANWRGVAYMNNPPYPPSMAFVFENEASGRKIFERWRERFGNQDKNEEIYISIVRNLPSQSQNHYCVIIAPNLSKKDFSSSNKVEMMTSRSRIMEPPNSINLDRFLSSYKRTGVFYLMPAFGDGIEFLKFAPELVLTKKELAIKSAEDVVKTDIEYASFQLHLSRPES